MPPGLAADWWIRGGRNPNPAGQQVYEYLLQSPPPNPPGPMQSWQVALAAIEVLDGGTLARWNDADFFIPPSLWGTGIGTGFLTRLCEKLSNNNFERCQVKILEGEGHTDPSSRAARTDTITFYKTAGFNEIELENGLLERVF